MSNLLLGVATMRARQKREFRGIWRNRSSQTCSGDLAWPESGAAFVNVGGAVRMELFALESSGAYVKSIALRVTMYWLRRREEPCWLPSRRAFFERKTQDFTRYFQSLDTNSCELIVIDRAGGHIFAHDTILCSDHVSAHIFWSRAFVSPSTMGALQREKRKSFVHR